MMVIRTKRFRSKRRRKKKQKDDIFNTNFYIYILKRKIGESKEKSVIEGCHEVMKIRTKGRN